MAGYGQGSSGGGYGNSQGSSAGGARGVPRREANPEGMRVLEDLLRRPPVDVASWALDQARDLQRPDVNVESLPIFQLAGALNAAPKDMKQILVQRTMAGFGDLPATRRVEAVRLAMQSQDILQKADNLEVTNMARQQHAAAMQRLRVLEAKQAASGQGNADGSPPSGQGGPDELDFGMNGQRDPLIENLLKVAKEARFNEMPPEELQVMAQTAHGEAHRLIQPQQLLDVVAELNPVEREQLTEALVEARVVPEEQRGVLEEAVRPGGYADKLAAALTLANRVTQYSWVFVALPFVELLLALIFGYMSCGTPLVPWLRFDALLAVFVAAAAYFTGHTMAPVYAKLQEDPVGAVQRWQTVADARSWKIRLETAVPGVTFETYRVGAIGLGAIVIGILIGAIWAVVGVLELLATVFMGCAFITTCFCIVFIGMRFGCVVGMFWGLYYVMDEIQNHRSRSPMLGSSLLPMSEDALPHSNPQAGNFANAQYNQNPQYGQQGQNRPPMYG